MEPSKSTGCPEPEGKQIIIRICMGWLLFAQAAQSRKVNNYKDLYGNLDNKMKKIFTRKSSQ